MADYSINTFFLRPFSLKCHLAGVKPLSLSFLSPTAWLSSRHAADLDGSSSCRMQPLGFVPSSLPFLLKLKKGGCGRGDGDAKSLSPDQPRLLCPSNLPRGGGGKEPSPVQAACVLGKWEVSRRCSQGSLVPSPLWPLTAGSPRTGKVGSTYTGTWPQNSGSA